MESPQEKLRSWKVEATNRMGIAHLSFAHQSIDVPGVLIFGSPWERFGRYNHYLVIRDDLKTKIIPAHAGELVPGSTEDLVHVLKHFQPKLQRPNAPMTLELDPTNLCFSKDCGGHCFSASYRSLAPKAHIPTETMVDLIQVFSRNGGRILRFDGGGDPLSHPDVRNGFLPELAHQLGLKTTILTAGDAIQTTNLERIGAANCYLRVSLNAAKDETRQLFHGNKSRVSTLFQQIESFAGWLRQNNPSLPIGSTFLISHLNFKEVLDCAIRARDSGINHFSVRRVLGPATLRPFFTNIQLIELEELLQRVRELDTDQFRVFAPWRTIPEEDLNPSKKDFSASTCWQSSFKTIIEPTPENGYKTQLCGRYRGNGIGQKMQMEPLSESHDGKRWVKDWQDSFSTYPISRPQLPQTCLSCIDRGFIRLMDQIIDFINPPEHDFVILHLNRNTKYTEE